MKKELRRRPVVKNVLHRALKLGFSPLAARIVAGRIKQVDSKLAKIIRPSLAYIDHPVLLKNSNRAAKRICQAINGGERIAIVTDYDVDGITSHIVLQESLFFFRVNAGMISHFIGHRLEDGYGVSDGLTDKILAADKKPGLLITADCGSSDEKNIRRLTAAGIEVIVTDHHAIPDDGVPASAHSVINPVQSGCGYPDKFISGCMVAWLLMCHVRNLLIEQGQLRADTGKMSFLLDLVALSTVADAVSLFSAGNRAVVLAGLDLLNKRQRPCWRAMADLLGRGGDGFKPDDLGFQIGPRINARGRLADPFAALNFLAAEDDRLAAEWLALLDQDNNERKAIEREMLLTARDEAERQVAAGQGAVVVKGDNFHSGVQGIVASRLVDYFGRPAVVFSPATAISQLSGSARSIDGIYLIDILKYINERHPGLFIRFGGHRGAAGMTICKDDFNDFQQFFSQAVAERIDAGRLIPLIWTDGRLKPEQLSLATVSEIDGLRPYGREFDEPVFEGTFLVKWLRPVGAEPVHLALRLSIGRVTVPAIWFRAIKEPDCLLPIAAGDKIVCAYRLSVNEFRGQRNLQLIIVSVMTDS